MEGRKNKNKENIEYENLIQNTKLKFKNKFFKKKKSLYYKPTCEVGSVREEHFLSLCLAKGAVGAYNMKFGLSVFIRQDSQPFLAMFLLVVARELW
jgi:hypothetical protein